MDANTFRMNKILGLVLGTLLFLQVVHMVDGVFTPAKLVAKPGSEVGAKKEQPAGGGAQFESLLASASVQRGAQTAKECELCHNLGKGQGSKIGPDLYGVVGRKVASEPGFNYSAALKAKGGTWTFGALNVWLTNPRTDVPGTLMTFAGIESERQRADVIAYLNSNSDKLLPLPKTAQAQPNSTGPSKQPAPSGSSQPVPADPPAPAPAK
jgi:cytochrome c